MSRLVSAFFVCAAIYFCGKALVGYEWDCLSKPRAVAAFICCVIAWLACPRVQPEPDDDEVRPAFLAKIWFVILLVLGLSGMLLAVIGGTGDLMRLSITVTAFACSLGCISLLLRPLAVAEESMTVHADFAPKPKHDLAPWHKPWIIPLQRPAKSKCS